MVALPTRASRSTGLLVSRILFWVVVLGSGSAAAGGVATTGEDEDPEGVAVVVAPEVEDEHGPAEEAC